MKKFAIVALTVCLTACQATPATHTQSTPMTNTNNRSLIVFYQAGKKIVFYQAGKKDEVLALFHQFNAEVIYDYQTMNGFAIRVNPNDLQNIKHQLEKNPNILGVNNDDIQQLH